MAGIGVFVLAAQGAASGAGKRTADGRIVFAAQPAVVGASGWQLFTVMGMGPVFDG
jgi:hypothetical protein